jgi:hypothetical protein
MKKLTGYEVTVSNEKTGLYILSDPFHHKANAKAWMKRELKRQADKGACGKIEKGKFDVGMDWGDNENTER